MRCHLVRFLRWSRILLLLLPLLAAVLSANAADPVMLWQIGKPDNDNREFALAPNRYAEFQEDGFFVVGRSDAKRDWPYAHPGPDDGWAGGRPHTFNIVFGLKATPQPGDCRLLVDLVDTQSRQAPRLRIEINGKGFDRRMPAGAGDDSIYGQPAKGKEHKFEVVFPASLLRAGANEIGITTVSGCWVLYDWLGLETPPGAELADAQGTVVASLRSPPVLVERGGRLYQTIELALRHLGEEVPVRVRVDGREATNLTLRATTHNLEIPVPPVDKETSVSLEVEVGGKTLAQRTVQLKPVRKWVVYLLPHSHVDIGYTHVQTDVERAQWKYLEMGIETARRSANNPPGSRFKWNVEVLWAVDSYLRQATPEKREQFIQAVKAGQVGLQALYGNELTGLCRPEELLRLLDCAQRVAKLCDTPIQSAMITDVPGYTWGIVPAFAHSGVKYFSIGPNGGDRIGHTIAAWGDKPFWWIGPNGRDKVLVWMTGTGYYQVFRSPQKLQDYLAQLEAKGYPYDFVQVRHCLGDNGAPDVNFPDQVKAWNETHAYPKLVIATSEEMFKDFEQRYGDQIPQAKGDFTPYWEDGAASSARETALNRASAERLTQAETLFAMLNPKAYPAEEFYQAWRNVILYDEHTWGAHNSISQPDHPFVKSQWAIKQAFAFEGDRQSRKLFESALASRSGEPVSGDSEVTAVDVFNTTPHLIPDALAVIPKELAGDGNVVKTDPTKAGTLTACQKLASGELIFRACWQPYASRRLYIAKGKAETAPSKYLAKAEEFALSTRSLSLRLDPQSGAIASLKMNKAELVDTNSAVGLNSYHYLPGSDLKGLKQNGPVKISIKERGPLIASLLVESDAPGCNKLSREIRLHGMRNYVEIIDTVDKQAVRAKEGVHFGFAFNLPNATVRMDVPWGIVRPEIDQIPGACKNWFTVQHWVDIANDKYGVRWFTPDAPLVQIGGITANLIGSLSDPRAWMNHIEPSQTIYSWAMNNHWHTNYRAEQDGPTVFRYYIFPYIGKINSYSTGDRIAEECVSPLAVTRARGELPQQPTFRLSDTKAQVTAFKPSEDGKAWIVRFLGNPAKDETVELKWTGATPKAVSLSDTSEQPLKPVPATDKIAVPASSIVTIRVERPE